MLSAETGPHAMYHHARRMLSSFLLTLDVTSLEWGLCDVAQEVLFYRKQINV